MITKPEVRRKPVRSFVVRTGRMTDAQRHAFELGWPTFGLRMEAGPLDARSAFGRAAPLVVEIGFGMGDSLLQMCRDEPEKDFVGIEVHAPGVGRLMRGALEQRAENLRIYMADANDVLQECFGDQSIDRLQIYFPDPWHKKRHNKRRIVTPAFVELATRKLKRGGLIHLATDWEPYAEQIIEVLSSNHFLTNCAPAGLYAAMPAWRPATKFEKRGIDRGHRVRDIVFRKVSNQG